MSNEEINQILDSKDEFKIIYLLDNFDSIQNDELNSDDLSLKLFQQFSVTDNLFIRQYFIKIICELSIFGCAENSLHVISLITSIISSENDQCLVSLALKYLPNFEELSNSNAVRKLVSDLTESDSGEISSQAFYCLGQLTLLQSINLEKLAQITIKLKEAQRLFTNSKESSENRDDANFWIILVQLLEKTILAGTRGSYLSELVQDLKKCLIQRKLYDSDSKYLKIDFLVYGLINIIWKKWTIVTRANIWTNVQNELINLIRLKKLRESITIENEANFVSYIENSVFSKITKLNYQNHLFPEKERIITLQNEIKDKSLIEFIGELVTLLPDVKSPPKENLDLLVLLLKLTSEEKAKKLYQDVLKKNITNIEAISSLLLTNSLVTYKTGSPIGEEIYNNIKTVLESLLENYSQERFSVFCDILEEVIRYARTTMVGHSKNKYLFLYNEEAGGSGINSLETDLQESMYSFFLHSPIATGLEHEKAKTVDGGRIDIVYKRDNITIPIELKRGFKKLSKEELEEKYIAQAQTYTAGYDQLGIFVLMDLSTTPKNEPPPNFKDWFAVHHLKPSRSLDVRYPDYVISVIIKGNKYSPSQRSSYG